MIPVRWTKWALADLDDIVERAATSNPKGAQTISKRIHAAEITIRMFPRSARFNRKTKTYEAVVRGVPFLLIYTLADQDGIEGAVIRAVFHTARDPKIKPGE